MLKIKDDVDLKELEKFNFEYDEDNDYWFYYAFTEPSDQSEVRYYIDNKDRRISVGFDMYVNPYKILDKIYDLIQARISRKGVDMEIRERCISKKEYLKRDDSNVGYALHVQNNIKKDDYARLNTGQIVKVTGIRENQVDKKAIYFGIYDEDWCNSAAVENFSENIIDLIEVRRYSIYTRCAKQ